MTLIAVVVALMFGACGVIWYADKTERVIKAGK